jgi:hypothetical protein
MSYFERYLKGEDVWPELMNLGSAVRSPELRADVDRITSEIVDRMVHNVEDITARLHKLGYKFGEYDRHEKIPYYRGPLRLAKAKDVKLLETVEGSYGTFPLLLRSWYSTIASVDLTGYHPEWTVEYPDPLVISDLDIEALADEYEGWESEDDGTKFRLAVAPDFYHKANVSGGSPYAFELPNECIDGRLVEEPDYSLFIGYLRRCIKWGGFPGIVKHPSGIPKAHLEFLTHGLRTI